MRRPYLKADLARDLGLSGASISKLAARGMPTHSRDAAEAWRHANLQPSWMKPTTRARGAAAPADLEPDDDGDALLAIVRRMAALAADDLQPWLAPLREVLHELPQTRWAEVSLTMDTWRALLGDALPALADPTAPPDSPEDAEIAGEWLFAIAAGHVVLKPAPSDA